MKLDKNTMLLYAVTDRYWLGERTLEHDVEEALKGGVTCIQLREKNMDYNQFLNEAVSIKKLCQKYNVPFIVNDNLDVAINSDADGIHIGQHDANPVFVREKIGNTKIMGVSVQTPEQAVYAQKNGADYLGVGSVFTTTTKADASAVSLYTLKEICNCVSIPVCAIGGININNINMLAETGINGVALVSAVFAQNDIMKASSNLYSISKKLFNKN